MANLTLAVDDQLLRRARLRALEQGTSVNALLRDYLETFAGARAARRQAIGELPRFLRSGESLQVVAQQGVD